MFIFWKIWRALYSCNTHFEIRPFAFLPTSSSLIYCVVNQYFPGPTTLFEIFPS